MTTPFTTHHKHENCPSARLVYPPKPERPEAIYKVRAGYVVLIRRGLYLKATFNSMSEAVTAIHELETGRAAA
ncbi:hypothetical protein [Flexibacterium corallicola]|uniref:hypothetical protein n=1 Tax=Flexibacterium corallicola TaxID=3037259 RepID=UPI00286FA9FD|nr:hypothetical protein [Pseudovibrio sp. M1P-2-3]